MLLDFLKPLTAQRGPFVTVTLDVSAIDPASSDHPLKRWQAQRQKLDRVGVPEDTLVRLDERAAESSARGGENTRIVCATPDRVALDIVVPGRPLQDESSYSPVPHLMPLVRLMARAQPYVVVRVDRRSADITVVGMTGRGREHSVDGDHDVIHKVPGGGWSQRRWQSRADSWAQNARAVAGELDSIVLASAPELLLLEGDDRAVSDVMDHLGSRTAERTVWLDTGGRAAGAGSATERRAVTDALRQHRDVVRAELLDEFAARMGGDAAPKAAVEGLDDVVAALQEGQVEHLLIDDDAASPLSLWVGHSPLSLSTTRDGAAQSSDTANRQALQEDRADAVLVWSLAGSGGAMTLLEAGDARPRGGIGALLRW